MSKLLKGTVLFDLFRASKKLDQAKMFISVLKGGRIQEFIVKLNTDQMKLKFINSDGVLLSDIGGDYSPKTVVEGNKKNAQSVDLLDTKEFHDSFEVVNVSANGFDITSDPFKDGGVNLLEQWGEKVEGLTFESMDALKLELLPLFINYTMDQLR